MNSVHSVYFSVPSHPSVCCKDLCVSFLCVIFTNEQCSQGVLLSAFSPQFVLQGFVCVMFTNEQCSQYVLLSVRSPQWLRGKWWSLKRHVPDYQEMDFQGKSILLSSLSVFYLGSACEHNRPYGLCQSSLFNHSVDCHIF